MLKSAIIFMNLALAFYSAGVWAEKIQGTLKRWHVAVFWMGLVFDTIGTAVMSGIAQGGFKFNLHGITGALAIILMLIHALWATIVIVKNQESMKQKFHQFSIAVWGIWLVPFITGAVFAMTKI